MARSETAAARAATGTGATGTKVDGVKAAEKPVENPVEKPVRVDQTQCPRCNHWGCPRVWGSTSAKGVDRIRRCGKCANVFKTRQKHGEGESEKVVV